MDAAEEQRILAILRAAQDNPAALAFAPLDLVFREESAERRQRLRDALLAAAVPHWFDAPFLASLLATDLAEAAALMADLRRLANVEAFPARGEEACNVHEASRLPLRQHLRSQHPDLWRLYSQRACDHLSDAKGDPSRIERLFHRFAAAPSTAIEECTPLRLEIAGRPAADAALHLALQELDQEGWLGGPELVEVGRAQLWYRHDRGECPVSEAEATELLALARKHSAPAGVGYTLILVSDVCNRLGHLADAVAAAKESLTIRQRLADSDPDNAGWQRDLSVSLNKLGDLAVAQGDLAAALRSFTESKAIRQRLADSDPDNAGWQRDLSVSIERLGDVAVAQGDLAAALRSFTESKAIRQRLADSDPDNAEWQRDLSVSLEKLGDLAVAQGDLAAALRSFTEARAIAQRLADSDPDNAGWQRDLSVSLERLGNLAVAHGDLAAALRSFTESKAILKRLADSDPDNAGWQRDLSVSLERLGDLAVAQGDLAAAWRFFTEDKAIRQRLADSDPDNAEWQRDLSLSLMRLGDLAVAQGDLAAALRYFTEAKAIAQRLADSDPANAEWQRDLAVSHFKLSQFARKKGDAGLAEAELRACYGVLEGMKRRGMHFDPQMARNYEILAGMFGKRDGK